MQLSFQHSDDQINLDVEADGDGWQVKLPDGSTHRISADRLPGDILRIVDSDRIFTVPFAQSERGIDLSLAGDVYQFAPITTRRTGAARRAAGALTAPMGGMVADVLVVPDQAVDAYTPLVVVEAMKVYATVEAPFAGTVTSIAVKKGDRVELGQQLVDLEKAVVDVDA